MEIYMLNNIIYVLFCEVKQKSSNRPTTFYASLFNFCTITDAFFTDPVFKTTIFEKNSVIMGIKTC